MWLCARECRRPQTSEASNPLELELQMTVNQWKRMLRLKLQSSGRTASELTVSPMPKSSRFNQKTKKEMKTQLEGARDFLSFAQYLI